jgi:hypothetical protein
LPPLDYEVHFQLQKHEHHGLGYKGLESLNLFGHDHLFVQPSVEKQINNVKIRGQVSPFFYCLMFFIINIF